MADLDGTPRALANLDALPHRVDNRLPLPPDVRRVEPSMAGDDVREFDDFVRRGEASGRIDQARAHAERAGAHRFVDMAFHRSQFVPSRWPLLEAHYREAHAPVAHESRDVDPDPLSLHEVKVIAIRRPSPVPGLRVVLEPSPREFSVPLADWRGRVTAVPDDVGRHPLADRTLGGRLDEDPDVAVRVDVDEPGRDVLARRVDDDGGFGTTDISNPSDFRTAGSDVGSPPRRARAIENATSANHDIEGHRAGNHRAAFNLIRGRGGRWPPRHRINLV